MVPAGLTGVHIGGRLGKCEPVTRRVLARQLHPFCFAAATISSSGPNGAGVSCSRSSAFRDGAGARRRQTEGTRRRKGARGDCGGRCGLIRWLGQRPRSEASVASPLAAAEPLTGAAAVLSYSSIAAASSRSSSETEGPLPGFEGDGESEMICGAHAHRVV